MENRKVKTKRTKDNPLGVQHREVELTKRVRPRHWPDDTPMPEYYYKQTIPCPYCRRVLLDEGGQAVVCTCSREHEAWFRCRGCGSGFAMPVKSQKI